MSIHTLLKATEYIERREQEAKHGYSSTMPIPVNLPKKKPKATKTQGNRTTHNELEKNRRAHFRTCLEKLKEMVPLGPEAIEPPHYARPAEQGQSIHQDTGGEGPQKSNGEGAADAQAEVPQAAAAPPGRLLLPAQPQEAQRERVQLWFIVLALVHLGNR
ncbi:hypothetical protein HPB49_018031 [Dermacentor silvarum]|uniref:Uncharacterized protein n=1 Tax=Dermacentor silvarum TaxID=543639 RepID=A0ACB8DEM8_DERSI|nr:hypothetical protein HPB49_018031 [Dermacentor silvarum]